MELELERIGWSGYEAALETTVCQEETLESIVPDACPDVLRICDTEGTVCLRDKTLQEGRVTISGPVRAALLYLPEADFADVLAKAEQLRADYDVTVLPQAKKLGKQFGTLEAAGYQAAAFADNDDIRQLGQKK